MANWRWRLEIDTKVIGRLEKRTARVIFLLIQGCIFLPTVTSTKVSSRMEIGKVKGVTLGQTKATIEESGWLTR